MQRYVALALPLIALAGCAGTGGARGAFEHLPLFADGKARFALYYSCSGVNDLQNDLCDTAGRDFSAWGDERRVAVKRVTKADFDETAGVSAAKLVSRDKDLPYRVFVRFVPIAEASLQWSLSNDIKGGYTPPKAGYAADVFVHGAADGKLAAQTHLSNKVDAKDKADPTPYVHAGAKAVLDTLTPGGVAPNPSNY
jgi:hypothetical protein